MFPARLCLAALALTGCDLSPYDSSGGLGEGTEKTCSATLEPFFTEYAVLDEDQTLTFTSIPERPSFRRIGSGSGVFGHWDFGSSSALDVDVTTQLEIRRDTVILTSTCRDAMGATASVTVRSEAAVVDGTIEWFDYVSAEKTF